MLGEKKQHSEVYVEYVLFKDIFLAPSVKYRSYWEFSVLLPTVVTGTSLLHLACFGVLSHMSSQPTKNTVTIMNYIVAVCFSDVCI